jgi:hypothetical protein
MKEGERNRGRQVRSAQASPRCSFGRFQLNSRLNAQPEHVQVHHQRTLSDSLHCRHLVVCIGIFDLLHAAANGWQTNLRMMDLTFYCILTASSPWSHTSNQSGVNDPTGRKTSLVQQLQVGTAGSCVHQIPDQLEAMRFVHCKDLHNSSASTATPHHVKI